MADSTSKSNLSDDDVADLGFHPGTSSTPMKIRGRDEPDGRSPPKSTPATSLNNSENDLLFTLEAEKQRSESAGVSEMMMMMIPDHTS